MSERERMWALNRIAEVAAKPTGDLGNELAYIRQVAEAARNADPDVAKVLRAIRALKDSDGCSCPLTLAYLAEEIEKAFGIRFTDDGWEWAEDEP